MDTGIILPETYKARIFPRWKRQGRNIPYSLGRECDAADILDFWLPEQ